MYIYIYLRLNHVWCHHCLRSNNVWCHPCLSLTVLSGVALVLALRMCDVTFFFALLSWVVSHLCAPYSCLTYVSYQSVRQISKAYMYIYIYLRLNHETKILTLPYWYLRVLPISKAKTQQGKVLQCVAECCGVLRCAAVCCGVVRCGAVWCSVVQCGAVWCSVLQCGAVWCSALQCGAVRCSVLRCIAVCCSVLQCAVVVRCSWVPSLSMTMQAVGVVWHTHVCVSTLLVCVYVCDTHM